MPCWPVIKRISNSLETETTGLLDSSTAITMLVTQVKLQFLNLSSQPVLPSQGL